MHIWTRTGRKPLLTAGNADGDATMLRTARSGLPIRHDHAGREFACDTGAEIALAKAKERVWTVMSVQNDFKVILDLVMAGRAYCSSCRPCSPVSGWQRESGRTAQRELKIPGVTGWLSLLGDGEARAGQLSRTRPLMVR
jgi:hypothetical protein